jgi:hypothetical protein
MRSLANLHRAANLDFALDTATQPSTPRVPLCREHTHMRPARLPFDSFHEREVACSCQDVQMRSPRTISHSNLPLLLHTPFRLLNATLPRKAWTLNMGAVEGSEEDSYRFNPCPYPQSPTPRRPIVTPSFNHSPTGQKSHRLHLSTHSILGVGVSQGGHPATLPSWIRAGKPAGSTRTSRLEATRSSTPPRLRQWATSVRTCLRR